MKTPAWFSPYSRPPADTILPHDFRAKQLDSCICTLYSHVGHVSLSPTLPYKHLSGREEIPNYLVDFHFLTSGKPSDVLEPLMGPFVPEK